MSYILLYAFLAQAVLTKKYTQSIQCVTIFFLKLNENLATIYLAYKDLTLLNKPNKQGPHLLFKVTRKVFISRNRTDFQTQNRADNNLKN